LIVEHVVDGDPGDAIAICELAEALAALAIAEDGVVVAFAPAAVPR